MSPRSPWHAKKFPDGRMPAEAEAWRMDVVDVVIACGGTLTDVANAWGLPRQPALVISFLALRAPDKLDALRSAHRRPAKGESEYRARCAVIVLGAMAGLTQEAIGELLGVSAAGLSQWVRQNDPGEDIRAAFTGLVAHQQRKIPV